MADDERATVEDDGVDFDPTLKKKKSKKKVTLDLSDDESAVNAAAEGVDDMTLDAGDGEFGKKKKKKKRIRRWRWTTAGKIRGRGFRRRVWIEKEEEEQ